MTVIAVSNCKGGVGKTTTAVSLAAGLANLNRVLLVDGDSQGHVALSFGLPVRSGLFDWLAQVRALLAVRPMLCHEIAETTGCTTTRIQKLFINQPHGFAVVSRGPRGNLWGLA